MDDVADTDAEGFDFRKWYGKHGKKLNKSRRRRYANDPEYRERVLRANRDSRKRRREEVQVSRSEERQATKLRLRAQPWKVVEAELETEQGLASNKLYTIGALARVLGCSVQAIRLWEKRGVIRPPAVRNRKGDRLYSPNEIRVIHEVMRAQGRVDGSKVRKRSASRGFERMVRFKDGRKELTRLFRIGVLAKALDRTVLTVEQMELRGALPPTPFRASRTGYRLYTLQMIQAAKEAMDARDGVIRGRQKWRAFYQEVLDGWTDLGVMGAKLVPQKKRPKRTSRVSKQ